MNLFDLYAKITLDTGDYEKNLDSVGGKISSFGSKLKSGLATAAKVGAAAITAASTAVVAFGKSAIDAGSQFDSSMSQVAATMGVTVDEIGDLRDFAMEMGAKTAFSASQAADALNYMALAGYDAEQSMQALPNVLNLAAAGGIELAAASDMVTDAQSALGLSMEESAELVDKMAMASSKSNTSVAQLGEAILTIGGTAKNLSGGTTELSTALGILADNGIKGAEGGIHLRNIMMAMTPTTGAAAAAFNTLNLETYDAEGNLRSLEDIFLDMGKAMEGMTDYEKEKIKTAIFNKTDVAAVNAMLSTTGERWEELTGYIDNASGSAEKMANTQLDNLTGDITLFKSALEGAQIVMSDQLTPTIRGFVQFGSEAVSTLSTAFQEGGLSGAMEALGTILSDGLNMVIAELPNMVDAGMQLLGALGQGLIDNVPVIIDAALEIIMMLVNTITSSLPEFTTSAIEIIGTLASGIADALPELIPTIVDVVLQIVDTLIENVDMLVDAAIEIILALADGLIDSLPTLLEKAPEIITKLVNAIIDNAPKLFVAAGELIGKLAYGIVSNLPEIGKGALEILDAITEPLDRLPELALEWGTDLIAGFIDGIKSKITNLKTSVSNIAKTVKDFLGFSEPEKGPLSNFHTYAPDMMKLFADGIRENSNLLKSAFNDSLDFGSASVDSRSSGMARFARSAFPNSGDVRPISITVQSVLDGKVIGETSYQYARDKERAYGLA